MPHKYKNEAGQWADCCCEGGEKHTIRRQSDTPLPSDHEKDRTSDPVEGSSQEEGLSDWVMVA
jgi:hypothetical protein